MYQWFLRVTLTGLCMMQLLSLAAARGIWWVGQPPGSKSLTDATNWEGGIVPGIGDTGIIGRLGSKTATVRTGDSIEMGGLHIGSVTNAGTPRPKLSNYGHLAVDELRLRAPSGQIAKVDMFAGSLLDAGRITLGTSRDNDWTHNEIFIRDALVDVGAGGIRFTTTDAISTFASVRISNGGTLDLTDAGLAPFPEVTGNAFLTIDEGGLLRVAGRHENVADLTSLASDVTFSVFRGELSDFVFQYDEVRDWTDITVSLPTPPLFAGDADQDQDFDQLDILRVLQAGKYLTGLPATWGEGDWDGAPTPDGIPGNPPPGNGLFDQQDIVASLLAARYLVAVEAARAASQDDDRAVPPTAETAQDVAKATDSLEATSNIQAADHVTPILQRISVPLDTNPADRTMDLLFMAASSGGADSVGFRQDLPVGTSQMDVTTDLRAAGSSTSAIDVVRDTGVDYVAVPEPSSYILAAIALCAVAVMARQTGAVC